MSVGFFKGAILKGVNWKLVSVLFILTVLAFFTGVSKPEETAWSFRLIGLILMNLTGIFFAVLLGVGFSTKVGLSCPVISGLFERGTPRGYLFNTIPAIGIGILLAGLAVFMDILFFDGLIITRLRNMRATFWPARFGLAFSAGTGEEILYRLFFMSFFVWLMQAVFKCSQLTAIWTGIILAGILFGLGHLPKEAGHITAPVIARAMLLNGIAGATFGWLFWRRGLESAIIAHFSADLFIYGVVGYLV